MTDWYYARNSLAERRRQARRDRRRRRAAIAVALVAALAALAAIVASAGGSHHGARGVRHVRSAQRPAVPVHHGPTAAQLGDAAVRRVLDRMPYVTVGGWRHREVALTFDDGPGPYTEDVVHVLQREHVPATFFEIGRQIPVFRAAARAAAAHGTIGDHTQNHPPMALLGPGLQASEIDRAAQEIRGARDPSPVLFRPPYMSYSSETLALLRQRHLLMVLWTIDSQDYREPGVSVIVYRVLSGIRPGAIVLMHDGGGIRSQTVEALPIIIRALRTRHYRFVTVPELMRTDPPPARQPRVARGIG